jgi:hypothetical protein
MSPLNLVNKQESFQGGVDDKVPYLNLHRLAEATKEIRNAAN